MQQRASIPGTIIFDGAQAQKGYALNRMCFSFNDQVNRAAFRKDEDAYMRHYGLNPQQAAAIRSATCWACWRPAATSTTWPSSPASSAWTCRTSARSRPG